MPQLKYITINGVMKKNPEYVPEGVSAPFSQQSLKSLAIVSSPQDMMLASEIQTKGTGMVVPMSESTSVIYDMLQDNEILKNYKSKVPLDGKAILERIGQKFTQYATPFGMVNKLMMLNGRKLDFLMDDSGSMSNPTDVDALEATEPLRSVIRKRLNREPYVGEKMTRLQEAEDRLHIMIGILAYIPVEYMQVRFLNDHTPLILDRTGKTPEQFEEYAHKAIRERFAALDLKGTPIQKPLQEGLDYPGEWSHYLFNDGEPDEGGAAIAQQIIKRKKSEDHPLALISCTNKDEETAWMKRVDSQAQYVAEIDDYQDELSEVQRKQGEGFPYTRGLWILCQLVASMNPFDLDALDENLPLTNYSLSNILGRQLNPHEYQYYFERNPNAVLYVKEYSRFLQEEGFARQIISTPEQEHREKAAGYKDGERPQGPLANIGPVLASETAKAYQVFLEKYSVNQPFIESFSQQLSATTIAPQHTFMPPPVNKGVVSPSYESSMDNRFK